MIIRRGFCKYCLNADVQYIKGSRFSTRIIITERIRRMGEGTVISMFVSPHLNGGGGATRARSGWLGGGYPGQVWIVGRGYPSQVWMVRGVLRPGLDGGGTPHHDWMGYPPGPGLEGGTPTMTGWGTPCHDWMGYPPSQVWMVGGTPYDWMGYSPPRSGWWGVPPHHDWMGYPPHLPA